MSERHILANRWRTPDGTLLHSKYRHDCQMYTDTLTGEFCLVDGGNGYYIRLAGTLKDECVYSDDPHEKIREAFMWGSLNNGFVEYKELVNLTTEHIEAILETQTQLQEHVRKVFLDEVEYRLEE